MRPIKSAQIPVLLCLLAFAGCGSDEKKVATATVTSSTSTPSTTATSTSTSSSVATVPTTTAPTTEVSGGVNGASSSTTTAAKPKPSPGEVTPSFSVKDDVATAEAPDDAFPELWCEEAQKGAYDDKLGDAVQLVITVKGSSKKKTCELPEK